MKNLFKNSFKSFFKSKISIFLISFLIFISITIFTLLTSSILSFRKSYEQVIYENKLHDFTSKEKYDLSGDLAFDKGIYENQNGNNVFVKDKTNNRDIAIDNNDLGFFSSDAQYIYFDNSNGDIDKKDNPILEKGFIFIEDEFIDRGIFSSKTTKRTPQNIITRFKKEDILLGYDENEKDKVKNINNTKKNISFEILYKEKTKNSKRWSYDKMANNKNDYSSSNLKKYIENQIQINSHSWISTSNFVINELIESKKEILKSEDLTDGFDESYTKIELKVNFENFKKWMIEKMNDQNYYIVQKNVEVYNINPSPTKSTGVFKNLLNEVPGTNVKNSFSQKLKNWILLNGFNEPIVANNPETSKKIEERQKVLKKYLESYIIERKRENYLDKIKSLYGNKLYYRFSRSVNISDKENNYKVVQFSKSDKINKLKIFEGYNLPNKSSDEEMNDLLKAKIKAKKWNEEYKIDKNKKFKWIAKKNKDLFITKVSESIDVIDPSSYFAYASPGYVDEKNIPFVNPANILNDPYQFNKLQNDPGYIYDKYSESVITLGEVKFIIIGKAIQPDYSFPIISASHPVPNSKKEAILFANEFGYLKSEDSYRGNEKENYISFKWKENSNLSDKEKNYILYDSPDKINKNGVKIPTSIEGISRSLMNWPKNIKIISKNNDASEQIILSPHRIIFLEKLKNTIEIVAAITITLLLICSILFIGIFIKKHINQNKKQFGILLASGYSRHQISLSNIVFALIIMIIPAILGYSIGLLLQYPFIKMFQNYWTLPINKQNYTWLSFILYVFLPFIFVVLFSYFMSYWELRKPIIEILNGLNSKKGSFISNKMISLFSWIGIKNKISISLFFTNFSKMIMIFLVLTASLITLSIGFTTIGKFRYAQEKSQKINNYNFSINLITPTNEGGLIKRLNLNNMGIDFNKNTNDIYSDLLQKSKIVHSSETTWMVPISEHAANSKTIKFLENKIQFQSLLNLSLVGFNPWKNGTESLIPEGQKLTSDKQRRIFNNYGITIQTNQQYKEENWFKNIQNPKIGVPLEKNVGGFSINEKYLKFIINTMRDISLDFDTKSKHLPTLITYKSALTNPKDETYTYIDATYIGKNISGKTSVDRVNIYGLKNNTKMVNIPKEKLDRINEYKPSGKNEIPIIVNSYFSDIYNIKKNEIIKMTINNKSNRNFVENNEKSLFKILDVVETYNNSKIYTTQYFANKAIGLNELKSNNPGLEAFNGVFSKSESPILLKTIPLYSESGYYPGTDILNSKDELTQKIVDDIKVNGSAMVKRKINNVSDYLNLYSKNPYIASYSNVDWSKMSQYAFDSTLDLSIKIIFIIESLAIIFSIIFIIIITIMLIGDNKKFISTLKVMGYKTKDINKIFFKSIIPSFIIAIIISVPIIFGFLLAIKLAIINFGFILIPLDMIGWEIISAFIIISLLSGVVYYLASKELKNASVLEAFID